MPLGIFKIRSVSSANTVGALMAAGMFAYFFFSALYMSNVLGYTPLEVGLAYLPGTILWGASSIFSDRFVMRFGIKPPLLFGLGMMLIALLLFARAPADGNFLIDILPATLFVGLGGGIAFNPLLLAAMGGVAPSEAGLASGVVNTAFMMGGALGLAVLAAAAVSTHRHPSRCRRRRGDRPERGLPRGVPDRRGLPGRRRGRGDLRPAGALRESRSPRRARSRARRLTERRRR